MAKKMKRQASGRSKAPAKSKMKKTRTLKRRGAPASKAAARAKAPANRSVVRAKGPQSLAIGLTANDAAASIAWYCDVLGFTLKERWEQEGVLLGATVEHGGVSVNIGQDDWKLGRDRQKGQGVRLFITTADDIDAYAKAISARGATLKHEPKDEWGFRAFAITDPDGYKLTIMRPLK